MNWHRFASLADIAHLEILLQWPFLAILAERTFLRLA
jgi:hypothetical protein